MQWKDLEHITKPWGSESIWAKTEKYVAKVLYIKKGHKLSRQYHKEKDETFMVWDGNMTLEIGSPPTEFIEMETGDTYHCPAGIIHRMIAKDDVKVVEVSTSELDDVVRLEDDYGR